MAIRVRMFAALRERWRIDEVDLACEGVASVGDIWRTLTGEELPPRVLAAVNREYARADTPVHSGDEVAFFPPVTGG